MEYLVHAFNRLTTWFTAPRNLEYVGKYSYEPKSGYVNPVALSNHQTTVLHAMNKYLYEHEIKLITQEYRRSEINLESILEDFFANDVEDHAIPFDEHVEYGLQCMLDAFRPPRPCRPVHLLDVQHHYPYKWQVNAEAPFSTDKFFLEHRQTFGDFIQLRGYEHIDQADFRRRYGDHIDNPTLHTALVPPKFGFMKQMIFDLTRRWHHIIKSGFTDLANMANSPYLKNRFVFPMLLHTKTAIVKRDDANKMRTIWGCSKPWIIADTMLYWEYIAWVKLNPGVTPMLWGYETFTGGWFRLNSLLFTAFLRKSFLTLDWSRFDKRAYFSLIHRIMQGVRSFLDFSSGYVPTVDYPSYDQWSHNHAIKLERLFLWTLENLFQAPIVLPNGDMYRRRFAGIPSGLYITQLLDSWYNYTMLATLLSALGFDPKACIIKVQGDDSIIRLHCLIPPDQHDAFMSRLVELALIYFNSIISVDKSEMRNSLNGCEVLSYRNHNGLPHRDEIKMLAQFYHTRARDPTPEITMAQAIGFAYASCANHKRVLWVLKDIYDYYNSLGFSPNRAGLSAIFGNSPDLALFPFELDHFPTAREIRQFFTSTSYINETQNAKTWPTNWFLSSPGE
ncbi:RNA-dependent RNA polymerase [Gaeumannomyces tritici partitivirus 2]|nr:RNA-dependent RNA polymerase [Gaeumannomyces tritici partitivirus 2]